MQTELLQLGSMLGSVLLASHDTAHAAGEHAAHASGVAASVPTMGSLGQWALLVPFLPLLGCVHRGATAVR